MSYVKELYAVTQQCNWIILVSLSLLILLQIKCLFLYFFSSPEQSKIIASERIKPIALTKELFCQKLLPSLQQIPAIQLFPKGWPDTTSSSSFLIMN